MSQWTASSLSDFSVLRAEMILLAARGQRNDQIATTLSIPRQIVRKWRKRFFEERLAGLKAEPRTGRPLVLPSRSGRAG
jgi:transposase